MRHLTEQAHGHGAGRAACDTVTMHTPTHHIHYTVRFRGVTSVVYICLGEAKSSVSGSSATHHPDVTFQKPHRSSCSLPLRKPPVIQM
ncbi:hypothetical protein AOLI_G00057970 [Acnodon oligacanthus]